MIDIQSLGQRQLETKKYHGEARKNVPSTDKKVSHSWYYMYIQTSLVLLLSLFWLRFSILTGLFFSAATSQVANI